MSLPPDFTALVRAYADDLYRYARWLCRDSHQAEDLVQETFLRSWRGFSRLRKAGSAKAWLITTLRREYFRNSTTNETASLDDPDNAFVDELLPRESPRLENILDAERYLNRLPDSYREVLVLQIYFGYTTNEIAQLLNITEPAVANRLLRARKAIAVSNVKGTVTPIKRSAL